MSKISYPQFVKDIADTYREATGTSEPVAVGEFTNKLTEVLSATGIIYKTITYNEDGSITLIDNNDIQHTISCVYDGSKLSCIKYDGRIINLKYDGDTLTHINNKQINFDFAPIFDTGSGESVVYKSITYNADNTVTLVDDKDVEHIMTCNYEDAKITSVILNEEEIALNYDGDKLIAVEDTVVNFDSILGDTDNTLYLNHDWYGYIGNISGMDYNCSVSFYDDYIYFEKPTNSYGRFYLDNIPLKANCKAVLTFTIFNLKENFSFYFNCESDYFSESLGIITDSDTYTLELPSVPIDSSFNVEIKSFKHLYDELAYFSIKDCYITYVPNDGDASNVGIGSSNISNIGDFQNGFIVGLTSKGKATQKTISVSSDIEVIMPVYINTEIQINNSDIEIETSVALESEE